jgi:hypothetical protein
MKRYHLKIIVLILIFSAHSILYYEALQIGMYEQHKSCNKSSER